jgi:hypothetical protein
MRRMKFLSLILALAALAAPLTASAEEIEITPDPYSWDFGNVEVGQSASQIVTLTSIALTPLTITGLVIIGDTDFAITSIVRYDEEGNSLGEVVPDILLYPIGSSVEVEVTYSPTKEGMAAAVLEIHSDDRPPPGPIAEFDLQGFGVPETPPPAMLSDVIAFFDDGLDGGTIAGQGPGKSANNRARAFGNMLHAADDLISEGELETACDQLESASQKVDGESRPPDFLDGDDVPALHQMLLDVMAALGC